MKFCLPILKYGERENFDVNRTPSYGISLESSTCKKNSDDKKKVSPTSLSKIELLSYVLRKISSG